jgi:CRISPR-associated protein Csm3
MADKHVQLQGRVFVRFNIETVTGLHIGGSDVGVEIGGVDKTVVRDPLTNRPYIPGSSLRGKMRSLTEKYEGLMQNQPIHHGFIHSCQTKEEYATCDLCHVYGVPGERDFAEPTRLIVRDVYLSDHSAEALETARTDLPYTEIKTEVSIDRVTAKANPRQMERVPAGVVFGAAVATDAPEAEKWQKRQAEMVYSVYGGDGMDAAADTERFRIVVRGMQFMEDDYLGGLGSRGSGKVRLTDIRIGCKSRQNYGAVPELAGEYASVTDLAAALDTGLLETLQQMILG